jgi:hypothetical protein
MKVRMRQTAAGPAGVLLSGREYVVGDALGAALVAGRAAEEIPEPVARAPVPPRAVLSDVETETAEPPQETAAADPPSRRRPKVRS